MKPSEIGDIKLQRMIVACYKMYVACYEIDSTIASLLSR